MKASRFWDHQRYSAFILLWAVPVTLGFLFLNRHALLPEITAKLRDPVVASCIVIFLLAALYHGGLGLQVIFEDYIHTLKRRRFWVSFIWYVTFLWACALVLAIGKVFL